MKWDQNNPEKVKDFIAKMKQDYAFKKAYAARRAWEFYNHPDVAGMCYVAVGGLDSITLSFPPVNRDRCAGHIGFNAGGSQHTKSSQGAGDPCPAPRKRAKGSPVHKN